MHPSECRQQALDCSLRAKGVAKEKSKQLYRSLARSWTTLAAVLEDAQAFIATMNELEIKEAPKD
jgi:hypothetical protein